MQKPTIFVTRRWPKETEEEMKKFFEVTLNQDDRPLTQSEIADGFESHGDAVDVQVGRLNSIDTTTTRWLRSNEDCDTQ